MSQTKTTWFLPHAQPFMSQKTKPIKFVFRKHILEMGSAMLYFVYFCQLH